MKLISIFILYVLLSKNLIAESTPSLEKTIKSIQENAFYEMSDEEVYFAAIKGVLANIDKRNGTTSTSNDSPQKINQLMTPKSYKDFNQELKSQITGIGAMIEFDPKQGNPFPKVTSLFEGGAKKVGIQMGDLILKVDNKSVNQYSNLLQLITDIRGPINSQLTLTIWRDGAILKKTITRQKIHFSAIESRILDTQIGYLKLKVFNEKTYQDTLKALDNFEKKSLSKLIIDIRDCPGGLLSEGVKLMKLFSRNGDFLFKIKYKNKPEVSYTSDRDGRASAMKIVILTNGNTASIVEAFAHMMKNNKRGLLMGQTTLGKATAETVVPLSAGYAIKYTIAKLYDKDDKSWGNKGVTPHIPLPELEQASPSKEKDAVIALAQAYLQK